MNITSVKRIFGTINNLDSFKTMQEFHEYLVENNFKPLFKSEDGFYESYKSSNSDTTELTVILFTNEKIIKTLHLFEKWVFTKFSYLQTRNNSVLNNGKSYHYSNGITSIDEFYEGIKLQVKQETGITDAEIFISNIENITFDTFYLETKKIPIGWKH
jgi:hypothetical protein